MSKYTSDPVASSPSRKGPGPLLWIGLAAGVFAFLGIGFVLVIVCLQADSPPPTRTLAELPPEYVPTGKPAAVEAAPAAKKESSVPQLTPQPSPPVVSVPVAVTTKVTPPAVPPAGPVATVVPRPVHGWSKADPPPADLVAGVAKNGPPLRLQMLAKVVLPEVPRNDPPVNRAIARGIAYLKKADDFRVGGQAMAGLTLLSCGVPAKDPAVARFARAVRAGLPLTATYELALCLLFLDRLGDPQDEAAIRRIALQLIAGQGIQGGWNYHCFALNAKQEKKLLTLLQAPVKRASGKTQVFTPRTAPGPVAPADLRDLVAVHYRPGQQLRYQPQHWHEDNSLTQFVILALWRGQKHGVPAERSLAMVEARFRASQNSDGSWGYKWGSGFLAGNFRADSMTCAGLLGLAVGRGVEPVDLDAKAVPVREARPKGAPKKPVKKPDGDPAMEKALLFIGQKIGAPEVKRDPAAEHLKANALLMNLQLQLAQAPPAQRPFLLRKLQGLVKIDNRLKAQGTIVGASARGDLYYLWSLERVAAAYDLATIGGKDWYAWGAPLIVAHQQDDGSWADLYPGVPDTCFALLFLKRVNVAPDLTMSLQRLKLSREAAGRMRDAFIPGSSGSPGERMRIAEPKAPPLRARE
jgi:hypothetical protein